MHPSRLWHLGTVIKSKEHYLKYIHKLHDDSLVPRPPLFLLSLCVHNNAQEWKIGEKQGRPGLPLLCILWTEIDGKNGKAWKQC